MKFRTLAIASLTAVLGMVIAAGAGGTVIVGPSSLTNNSVTDAKLRDSNGLSVIGRSANSSGDPADIVAGFDGDVLRRNGTTLAFGPLPETSVLNLTTDLAAKVSSTRSINTSAPLAGGGDLSADRTLSINANGIDNTLLRDSAALSVIGRSANSSGDPADIAAANDGEVLQRSGTSLAFGQVVAAGIATGAVTSAKILDGTIAAADLAAGAGDGAASITITDTGAAPTKNLTTEGTIDYFALQTAETKFGNSANAWYKIGGEMWASYAANAKGQTGAVATFTASQSGTNADGVLVPAGTTVGGEFNTANAFSSTSRFFFGWSAPSSAATRVMRANTAVVNAEATFTCWLDDPSVTTQSLVIDSGNGVNYEHEIKVTYSGGSRIHCKWQWSAGPYAGTKRLKLQNVTLAGS